MERVLAGRVALVTGVSRRKGIGFAVADRLAAMGADVFCNAFTAYDAEQPWGADSGGLEALQKELQRQGMRIEFMQADFADPDAPSLVVAAAVRALDHIDILVANHAYSVAGTLEELTAEQIDAHLLVNVAPLSCSSKSSRRSTRIQNRAGASFCLRPGQHLHPMPGELAYIASKGALHQLTASLAAHLAPRQITVNTIDPGATDIRMGQFRGVRGCARQPAAGEVGNARGCGSPDFVAGDGRRSLDYRADYQFTRRRITSLFNGASENSFRLLRPYCN